MPAATAASASARAASPPTAIRTSTFATGRRAADVFVERKCPFAELEHLAKDGHAPRSVSGIAEHLQRALRRGGIGVVAVVDNRHAFRQPQHFAAARSGSQTAGGFGDGRQRDAALDRNGCSGQDVGEIGAPDEGRRQIERSLRRRDMRVNAVDASAADGRRANVGVAIDTERHDTTGETGNPPRHHVVVGIGDEHGRRRGALEDLRLGIGDGVHRWEESQVRFAHVGPHPYIRFSDAYQRADFADVIHPQLDDGHLRPLPQLDERQRQPDVVVEVPAVADDAVPRREELALSLPSSSSCRRCR